MINFRSLLKIVRRSKAFLFLLIIMGSPSIAYSQKAPDSTFRVITYNIWNGFDWGKDSKRKIDCIEWIKNQKADVLALQELCGYTLEDLKSDAQKWGHQYAQILKTEGYPVGITSNKPIQVLEKKLDSLWHGMLHCRTNGIVFIVLHLSPADSDFRLKEAAIISEKIKEIENKNYIILGDFNAFSPMDASWMEEKTQLRIKYSNSQGKEHSNLRNDEFDYAVMSKFLAIPVVDLCLGHMNLEEAYTFPAPALIGRFSNTSQSIVANRQRIDFILASPSLAKWCNGTKVFNKGQTDFLSDHFPVRADFVLPMK